MEKLTKEQFDKMYVGERILVRFETKELAREFLALADRFGHTWVTGRNYLFDNRWESGNTCYNIFEGTRYDYWALQQPENYIIIKYTGESEGEEEMEIMDFTKSDLQTDDEIFYNGTVYYYYKKINKAYEKSGVFKVLDVDRMNEVLSTNEKLESITRNGKVLYKRDDRWRAEEDENYYYVDSDGRVDAGEEYGMRIDRSLWEFGNYFKTIEEAEKVAKRIRGIFEVVRKGGSW